MTNFNETFFPADFSDEQKEQLSALADRAEYLSNADLQRLLGAVSAIQAVEQQRQTETDHTEMLRWHFAREQQKKREAAEAHKRLEEQVKMARLRKALEGM